jgi:4-hydroxy-tetrahydrodipicolinate synthase
MINFTKTEARVWAKAKLRGVANVIIPSFARDLGSLNEGGIRHDVQMNIKHGFAGALLVSEVGISLQEYGDFCSWAVDEAQERQILLHHASFDTLDENIEAARLAEQAGVPLALLSYPASFYPESAEEVFEYTKAFCDATNMAVMLFPVPLWGFDRIHPADLSANLIERLLAACPNIVCIKAEGGMPSIQGFVECLRRFGNEVIVTAPLEGDMIPLAQLVPIQFSGTSNTEYFGPMIPRIFKHLQHGDFDAAAELYWKIHPARRANAAVSGYIAQTGFLNRAIWKYQAWLQGYNGGPLRRPTMRINDAQMATLRNGLIRAGLAVTNDHDR